MKRRILALVLCFALCLSLMSVGVLAAPGDYAAYFDGGTGTAEDPYQIANLEQLESLAAIVSSDNSCAETYFVLTADIGSSTAPVTTAITGVFSGHFDGAGHTVTLDINSSGRCVGLFGRLDINGTISNVATAGSVSGGYCVGGVCGENYGNITNCVNSGDVGSGEYVGGVCGENNGSITNCVNSGDVGSDGSAGGVCGVNNGTIANCCNSGNVDSGDCAGGVCGDNYGNITNCCGIGSVTANYGAGDVCSTNYGDVINCCYSVFSSTGGINISAGSNNEAYGLNSNDSMVELLNDYISDNPGTTAGWRTWKLGANGPEFAHAHRFTGDYVQGTGDNAGKHARKCSDPDCNAVGYTDDSGNPVEGYVPCVCDQEVVADAFLKEEATCVSKKLYCKSCVCGYCDKSDGSETFTDPDEEDPTGHAWKYSALGNVLTVTCESERCTYPRPSSLLVLNAPNKVYDGQPAVVSILGGDAWEALMGSGSLPTIEYYDSTGNKLDVAPTNAGSYTAKINAGGAQFGATAEVTFTIQPALLVVQAENKTAAVGAEVPAFTYSILAGRSVAENDVFNGRLSITLTSSPDTEDGKLKTAGSYDIVPEVTGGSAAGNYTFIPANGTLTVSSPNTVPIPAGATYTYSGEPQTFMILPRGARYDSIATKAEFDPNTGEFTGTDAGTYQVVLTLENDGDMWSDGTTEAKTIPFKIDPAYLIIDVKDKTATVGDSAAPAFSEGDYIFLQGPAPNDRSRITVALSYQNPDLNQAGSYEIQATVSGDRSNYQIIVAPGTLFVTSAGGAPSDGVPVPTPTTVFFYDGSVKTFMTIPADAGYELASGSLTGKEADTYPVELKLKNAGDKWSDGTTANKTFSFIITEVTAPTLTISADETGVYVPGSTVLVSFTAQDAANYAGEISVSYPSDCLSFDEDSSIGLPGDIAIDADYYADGTGAVKLVYPDVPADAATAFFTLAFTVKSGVALPDTADIKVTYSAFADADAAMSSEAIPGQLAKDKVTVHLLDVETLIVNGKYDENASASDNPYKPYVFTEYVTGYVLLNITGSGSGYTFNGKDMFLTKTESGRNTFSLLIAPTACSGIGFVKNADGTISLDDASVSAFVRPGAAVDTSHDLTLDPKNLGADRKFDVNGTGKIDIADVRAAFNCQNGELSVEQYMAVYLRADVNGDGVVDGIDVSRVVDYILTK